MRKIALVAALVLLSSVFVVAQSGGDQTPPGGDMIGSSPLPSQGNLGEQSADSAQNQRMTGNMGATKGYAGDPAYAGSSDYLSRENLSATGTEGQQEFTSTTAGRHLAEDQQNSPYDTTRTAAQPYLSGQFGQSNGAQQPSRKQPKNAKRANAKPAPPKR